MTTLRKAAQQALEALEYAQQDRECPSTSRQAITALRAALAQEQAEPCPNCASLEAQNTELDRKLAEMEKAYEAGYNAGLAHEREACAVSAWSTGMDLHLKQHDAREIGAACAAAIRARSNT